MKLKKGLPFILAGLFVSTAASSAAISGGQLSLNLDSSEVGLIINDYYSGEQAGTRDLVDDLLANADASTPVTGPFVFDINTATPTTGGDARAQQATTYDPSTGAGQIGLGGVLAFEDVAGGTGKAVIGDASVRPDGSDWIMANNAQFAIDAFKFVNVTEEFADDGSFTLSGDIEWGGEVMASFLQGTFGNTIGTFSATSSAAVAGTDTATDTASGTDTATDTVVSTDTATDTASGTDTSTDVSGTDTATDTASDTDTATDTVAVTDITTDTATATGTGGVGTPGVSPVPVPGAVWLFGSGLLGLMGMNRKKQKAA